MNNETMSMNDKIIHAKTHYPQGTRFKSAANKAVRNSTGRFYESENGCIYTDLGSCVYSSYSGKWAEIIK